jgi:methionine--tRNA ligase beta chain
VIECQEVVRDPISQEPIELKCIYYPDTRAGATPAGMDRVKGIIHWVESSTGVPCQVNLYDRLFKVEEPGKESGDFLQDLNPDSLKILSECYVEPSVAKDVSDFVSSLNKVNGQAKGKTYLGSLAYQFERNGYFSFDESTTVDKMVLNRVVTLKDTWQPEKVSEANERTRGVGSKVKAAATASSEPIEDIRRIAIRAAKVLSVKAHPESDKLLVCQVDCGDKADSGEAEPRTVVAGLAEHVSMDELTGKLLAVITNLKPAKVRGIESTAMILAASTEQDGKEVVEVLNIPEGVEPGELLNFQGKETSEPDAMLKSKGAVKAFERAKEGLKLNGEGIAAYIEDGKEYAMTTSRGPVKTERLVNAPIQ